MKQQQSQPLRHLKRIRAATWCVLAVERLWPLLLPLILLAALFATCAWLNVFTLLPDWLHRLVLGLFAVAALAAALLLLRFRLPEREEIDRQIEQASGLAFQPLAVQGDVPVVMASKVSARLWREHQHRMAQALRHLRVGTPHPDIPRRDVHGLRFVVFLLCAVGFASSFRPDSGRLADAFYFGGRVDAGQLRMDAWVTPPVYTNRPPVYLSGAMQGDGPVVMDMPQGSVVTVRFVNGDRRSRVFVEKPGASSFFSRALPPATGPGGSGAVYDIALQESADVVVHTPQFDKRWQFRVHADSPPSVRWSKAPQRSVNGVLELDYTVDDDFGAVKGRVEITPVDSDVATGSQALFAMPQINLTLPRGGKGAARTVQDFTNHPWAGMDVCLTLVVEDGKGQQGMSGAVQLTLPQRSFGNPLARALVEQRRLLVQDPARRDDVLDMLAALLARPEATIDDSRAVLALQTVWTRLSLVRDMAGLRESADYMWQVALGLEGGSLSAAAQRLKQAQQALRDALRHGAGAQEIEQLMNALRQAMEAYIAELAQKDAGETQQSSGVGKHLEAGELEKRLQDLQAMAQLGNLGAAEQMLAELEKMLDNLQVMPGGDGNAAGSSSDPRGQMQKQMDELADLMRRQQEMMDKTHRLEDDRQRGDKSDKEVGDDLHGLQEEQRHLHTELEELQRRLGEQGLKRPEGLAQAQKSMEDAGQALGQAWGEGATRHQSEALEAMRRGAQDLMGEMRAALKQDGAEKATARDPLGREQGKGAEQKGDALSDVTDVQRARRILDEIRKRLGNLTPQVEKDYLERLLKFD